MAAPPPASSCCQHCGAPDILLDIYENFCLLVCSSCFRRHENYISKSNAKSGYLLSDGDLYPLRYVEKENPRNSKFAQMKQYLVSQVEQVAISKHGSLDALELEKQRRMQAKLEQRMQKRQAEQRQEERRHRQAAQQQQLEATMLTDQQRTAVVVAAEGGQQSIGLEGWTANKRRKQTSDTHFLDGVEVEEF